ARMMFQDNQILVHLPESERERLRPILEDVHLETREQLGEAEQPVRSLHFLIDSAISVLDVRPSGRMIEVAVIGREGAGGCSVALGTPAALAQETVQIG